jgi:hypothetical protein
LHVSGFLPQTPKQCRIRASRHGRLNGKIAGETSFSEHPHRSHSVFAQPHVFGQQQQVAPNSTFIDADGFPHGPQFVDMVNAPHAQAAQMTSGL